MDKKEKKLATYKEFAKMIREVANIYSTLGDEPLPEEGHEREDIADAIYFVTNKHDFQNFVQPWKDAFLRMPFDVTEAIAWGKYMKECREKGVEPHYK